MLRRIHESSPSFCEGSGWGAPHPPVVVSARPPRGVLTIAGLTRSHAQGRPRTCACAGLTGMRGSRACGAAAGPASRESVEHAFPGTAVAAACRFRKPHACTEGSGSHCHTPRRRVPGSAQTPRLRRTRGLSPGPQLSGLQSEVENLSPLGGTSF